METKGNNRLLLGAGVALCLVCAWLSLMLGTVYISPGELLQVLQGEGDRVSANIILYSRVPRTLGTLLAGAALAVSGAVLQGVLSNYLASPSVIGVNAGAYIAEIVRGAIISIHHGQEEAARSTGLNKFQTMLYVIWPQAFRRMIPPLGNQFIISLKDTSLLVVIGVAELTRRGQEIISINFKAFEIWLAVAVLYLCLTLSLSYLLRIMERRMNAKIMKR